MYPEQDFRNINVKSAFRYGFVFSEHSNGNNLSSWNCDNAFVFSYMDHSSWFGRIHAQNCKNILVSLDKPFSGHRPGNSYVKIEQVGIEVNINQKPIAFNYKLFVDDPNNFIKGIYNYHIVVSNVGADNSVIKNNGGLNFKGSSLF